MRGLVGLCQDECTRNSHTMATRTFSFRGTRSKRRVMVFVVTADAQLASSTTIAFIRHALCSAFEFR